MRNDKPAAPGDREDDFEVDPLEPEAPEVDPADRGADLGIDLEADEELLDLDLGERDIDPSAGSELDDVDEIDPVEDEFDDEAEMTLLHDLGIDLDASDEALPEIDAGLVMGDDSMDDEVAA